MTLADLVAFAAANTNCFDLAFSALWTHLSKVLSKEELSALKNMLSIQGIIEIKRRRNMMRQS